jgi:hypothetical protein
MLINNLASDRMVSIGSLMEISELISKKVDYLYLQLQ